MSPKNKKKLIILRKKLDSLDNKLLKIIKKRCRVVQNVLSLKEKKSEIIDKKRGKFHYDSSVYPYVCTAVIKGKWNFKEYKKELYEIFYDKNFNIFSYYLTKLKF